MAYDMEHPEILDAAVRLTPQWLAGFFDGEGTVCAYKDKEGRSCFYVGISQAEPKIMALIALKFHASLGSTKKKNGKTYYYVHLSGRSALPLLKFIKDYVICKRRQVEMAMEMADLMYHRGENGRSGISDENSSRREDLSNLIKSCNRGIDITTERK